MPRPDAGRMRHDAKIIFVMAAHVETIAKRDEISNCGWIGCGSNKIILEFVGQPSPQGRQLSYLVPLDICSVTLEFGII